MPARSEPRPNSTAAVAPRAARASAPAAAAVALLAGGVLAIYHRTLTVPLLFDDQSSIAANATIRQLGAAVFSPPVSAGVGGRPLLNLTFALNYAFGGTEVAGYHAVNIGIHLLAAVVLFALVRRTLGAATRADLRRAATPLAAVTAMLWAWHPVQTEAVTYLSERAESLLGLFYLLTLYSYIGYTQARVQAPVVGAASSDECAPADPRRARRSRIAPAAWASGSVLAALAGALTKEVIVTAPVLVLLFDRTFLSGSFAAAWRRHGRVLVALSAASWIPVARLMAGLSHRGVGFGTPVGPWTYALGETRALVHYVGLVFWPHPLVFDYGPAVLSSLAGVWPFAAAVVVMLGGTVLALWRWPQAGFFPAAFFLLLAPTSSFVPIVWQPIAESRLYLPLAAVCAGVVLGVFALARRWTVPVGVGVAVCLAVAAARRNETYSSALRLWRSTVAVRPENPRARNAYADALAKEPGQLAAAAAQYEAALRLQPDFPEAHNNLGVAFSEMPGRLDDAVAQFKAAIRQRPRFAAAHFNLATTLERLPGRLPEAVAEYRTALRLQPDLAAAHYNLGTALERLPDGEAAAVAEYEAALRLQPNDAVAQSSLARALAATGRREAAVAEYRRALRLQPADAALHYNFANTLRQVPGGLPEAIAEYEAALRLRPDYVEAHNNLGTALNEAGRSADAIAQFKAALKLDPTFIPAHLNYAVALLKAGDRAGAVAQIKAVLEISPENAAAGQLLAQIGVTP